MKRAGSISAIFLGVDWILLSAIFFLFGLGLITMNSFVADNYYAERQIFFIIFSLLFFFICSNIDWRFLKDSKVLISLFIFSCLVLLLLFLGGSVRGTKSWIQLTTISIQPVELIKVITILIFAKYFSKRHIDIAQIRHLFISGFYFFIPFILVFLQPDFGGSIMIFFIWIGMILVSGVSRRHLFTIFIFCLLAFIFLWSFVFLPHQKQRVMTFLDPLSDIRGAGYNVFQSQIAVGSGRIFGKGVGYGTQSRLNFLPEHQTDFIFAAFAEEWGFLGVIFMFSLFLVVIWRILLVVHYAPSNFEALYGLGLSILIIGQFLVNIGMNIGLLPVAGLALPFVSYGGSHVFAEMTGLGILMGMRRFSRATNRENIKHEFIGPA